MPYLKSIVDIQRRTAYSSYIVHLSGGLRGLKVANFWHLAPIGNDDSSIGSIYVPEMQLIEFAKAHDFRVLGFEEVAHIDNILPYRMWTPAINGIPMVRKSDDLWGNISAQARYAGDELYADLSRNLGASIRAAGLQLRNASDAYNQQL